MYMCYMQSSEIEALHSEMEREKTRHSKELKKKDSEREIVSEELESLNEAYRQLELVFESQSSQLSHSNSEIVKLKVDSEMKVAELDKLTQQQRERRASFSRVSLNFVSRV